MIILIMFAYIEIVIVLLALLSNTLFTFMIHQASSLHFNCRNLLFSFAFSMYLLTVSHGLTVFEFLYEGKTYEYVYFVSPRGIAWRIVHEIGYAFQSFSLLLFSIERLVACICPASYSKLEIKILFLILTLISLGISTAFSLFIHMGGEMFLTTVSMDVVDVLGCLILLVAWKRSLLRYRNTVGIFNLEQRFQLSEVYTWTRHLIPAVLLASMSKIIVIVLIWILITGNYTGNDAALWVILYNNVLNVYTLVLPFVILFKHQKIRERFINKDFESSSPFLLLFTVSLFFLALTHGFQTFEFLIGIRPEDSTSYKDSIRMFVWSLIHEFAFALHTLSLFAFSVERYITAKIPIAQNLRNRTFSIIIAIIISILSMIYAQAIHLVNFHITLITCLTIVDMFALVILVLSSKISFKQYRNTAGKATLEQRFQISDVYIWTQALIPAACLAFLLKFIYVIVIWVLQIVEDNMAYQISVSHFFQSVMDLFTCGIPFLVSANHRRLNKSVGLFRNILRTMVSVD
ncbi:Protein CBG01451 [Caenorhabditis briggsae]|uniref:Protein CBG01451 n=1 Tax=Caenorhabditis briggsae TaxID=6238 RepID=A8WQN2_CAEBR|nr:Protein CBG01451 [Caenorhabditis briggsae]CAP22790.2 Protein CBG01451 [Caenorhabditis briggsae]